MGEEEGEGISDKRRSLCKYQPVGKQPKRSPVTRGALGTELEPRAGGRGQAARRDSARAGAGGAGCSSVSSTLCGACLVG